MPRWLVKCVASYGVPVVDDDIVVVVVQFVVVVVVVCCAFHLWPAGRG